MDIIALEMIEVVVATFVGSFIGCFLASVVNKGLFDFSDKIQKNYEDNREKRIENDKTINHNSD